MKYPLWSNSNYEQLSFHFLWCFIEEIKHTGFGVGTFHSSKVQGLLVFKGTSYYTCWVITIPVSSRLSCTEQRAGWGQYSFKERKGWKQFSRPKQIRMSLFRNCLNNSITTWKDSAILAFVNKAEESPEVQIPHHRTPRAWRTSVLFHPQLDWLTVSWSFYLHLPLSFGIYRRWWQAAQTICVLSCPVGLEMKRMCCSYGHCVVSICPSQGESGYKMSSQQAVG